MQTQNVQTLDVTKSIVLIARWVVEQLRETVSGKELKQVKFFSCGGAFFIAE